MFEIYLSNAVLKALKDLDTRIVEKAKKASLTAVVGHFEFTNMTWWSYFLTEYSL
jgi:hypothetical protein